MEKVLPKPEPEPRSRTTSAPRLISHAHVPPETHAEDPATLAMNALTEMFDLQPIFINLKLFTVT
jgi:hypothetical protein